MTIADSTLHLPPVRTPPSDQYYVSHVTEKGWITVYEGKPSTDWDRKKESDIDCPVIAHETGQRCMYPNFAEMENIPSRISS